ncbi:calmodulin-binding transcription activator 5 isoform X2 [Cucurbita pepo subsp. pepo]|uniref:calmodulin-binding transcription activator 5 isoform X2 n=1 Tax=Cucurbita pepo subsp. pepo TaxID=3664 RepID=UPI000C9D4EEA|nr:calmodulin-binding transcription activator 5 isoform X2 [Cucurbita pepo subsp. pepo]
MSLAMKADVQGSLVGSEIHGFHTLQELDVTNIREEASGRWLRPNEIHAILCNYKYFVIHVKPVNLPTSGTIVLFNRKMLRNFRKDGHNWKKKKDGKTIKEAHEHLKVGNVERIHVYYAHGLDNTTFVRRCYWLLDKTLEHIVLVHYRETQEVNFSPMHLQSSPSMSMNSNSGSVSDPSTPCLLSEELDSRDNHGYSVDENERSEPRDTTTAMNHEQRLHEINTLEWDELLVTDEPFKPSMPKGDRFSYFDQRSQVPTNVANNLLGNTPLFNNPVESIGSAYMPLTSGQTNLNVQSKESIPITSLDNLLDDGLLQSQDSFGRWINEVITESPDTVIDPAIIEPSISSIHNSFTDPTLNHCQSSVMEQIFNITDISPAWAFSTEKTKILITGYFHNEYLHLANSNILVVCGNASVNAGLIQPGVYRCVVQPHSTGLVNLFVSLDGHKPISQVLNFEYRAPLLREPVVASEQIQKWEEFQVQMRLAHLLFSTSRSLSIMSTKLSSTSLNEARKFAVKTSDISDSWIYLLNSIKENNTPFPQARDGVLEIILKSRLREWLIERVAEGSKKSTDFDIKGQGVIHLCAILGYTWAIHLFSWSGLSINFRDKFGWTALHWAAYYGREKMVAVLLSVGAKPNLVTDPSSKNPLGYIAADLASMNGYDGLAAYLSEKALVSHFNDMSLAGNVRGSLETSTITNVTNSDSISEEQMYMKETLAAYRTAADAAARIQTAFRENSLKQRTQAIEFSTPEDEARGIVAAMKIQHAYRNFESRKRMAAAARIQYRFRTWKIRKEFLNMRRHAIRIQAAFRGFQMRRQYRKILWSVGVIDKAILRWRLKRKGFRGLQVAPAEVTEKQEIGVEEDFYHVSQKQAEERVEKAVVRVQALFRSKKAQEEYRRMKLTYDEAALEYEELSHPDMNLSS